MAEGIKKISENVIIHNRALVVTDPSVADNAAISMGALWSDPTNKGLKIKTGANTFSHFDANQTLIPGSITTNLLANDSVIDIKIANGAITEPKLANHAVSHRTIGNGAVTEEKICDGAITSSKVRDHNILENHIANGHITNNKLADKVVTSDKIADKAINNPQLEDYAVWSRNLANNIIETRHYAHESIPNTAYQHGSVYGNVIGIAGIYADHLSQNAVVTNAIANGAVTDSKIADASIDNKHLKISCIGSHNIVEGAITNRNISDNAITTNKCDNKIITKDKLADEVVELIGNPVKYDEHNNVALKNNLDVEGTVNVKGTLTATKVYNAVFMDLAEAYEPAEDEIFNPGDIVQVNENGKLTRAKASSHFPIVGIVSDEYAECFGASEEEIDSAAKIPVGLIGKIHVNVIGPVKLGDKIALIKDGIGASCSTNNLLRDNIVGKALESNNEAGLKKVLCLVCPSL